MKDLYKLFNKLDELSTGMPSPGRLSTTFTFEHMTFKIPKVLF